MGYFCRKEIAAMLGVSVKQVGNNERKWGLDAARHDLNRRCIRYDRDITLRALIEKGLLECSAGTLPPDTLARHCVK